MRQRLLFLMLLMAVALPPCLGQSKQKFSVESFALDPYDLTAQSEQHRRTDSSGALYAIVKVSSTNPDDDLRDYQFSFGLLKHEVVEHDGELWLYVQRNAKTVTISREGYQTISKYDLKTTIEAGKTYVMQLSASAKPVYMQMVQFVVKPAGIDATVTIKSTKIDAAKESLGTVDDKGIVARALEYGSYTYEVLAPNYHLSEGRIDLNDRMKTHVETVTLRPNFSEMTLRVDADADIYVNGERKGRRTWSGILKAGNYNVECRQLNHRSSTQYITVAENDNRTIELTPPAPITGALAVTSRPSGASITIDGRSYGVTPLLIPDMLIGSHRVTLSYSNYNTESREVTVSENETAQLDVELNKTATPKPDNNMANGNGSTGTDNGHEWVDLGLSVKWATMNVGATNPGDYGDYFAWGETSPKSNYDWETYSLCKRSKLKKYCTHRKHGTVDNKTQLDLGDDAARANWGGTWRMPTIDELSELDSKCTWTWTSQNGHNGYRVTGPNGNSIFLPAAGYRDGSVFSGSAGKYWSSSLTESYSYLGRILYLSSSDHRTSRDYRCYGKSVRPVTEL